MTLLWQLNTLLILHLIYKQKQNEMELIYFLIVASPIIGVFLFALLVNWIITNIKKIEQNENII
jgi:presenilin-like A22 family membrane protease